MTTPHFDLGNREREIMEILYRRGEACVEEVRPQLSGTPHYSTVRTVMNKLERKGHLERRADGPRFVYKPTLPQPEAQRSAMSLVVEALFDSSTERAVSALLEVSDGLTEEELERIQRTIDEYRNREL